MPQTKHKPEFDHIDLNDDLSIQRFSEINIRIIICR